MDTVPTDRRLTIGQALELASRQANDGVLDCPFVGCEKSYVRRAMLAAHLRVHTGASRQSSAFPGSIFSPSGLTHILCALLRRIYCAVARTTASITWTSTVLTYPMLAVTICCHYELRLLFLFVCFCPCADLVVFPSNSPNRRIACFRRIRRRSHRPRAAWSHRTHSTFATSTPASSGP
jgi:hypothetical protein